MILKGKLTLQVKLKKIKARIKALKNNYTIKVHMKVIEVRVCIQVELIIKATITIITIFKEEINKTIIQIEEIRGINLMTIIIILKDISNNKL